MPLPPITPSEEAGLLLAIAQYLQEEFSKFPGVEADDVEGAVGALGEASARAAVREKALDVLRLVASGLPHRGWAWLMSQGWRLLEVQGALPLRGEEGAGAALEGDSPRDYRSELDPRGSLPTAVGCYILERGLTGPCARVARALLPKEDPLLLGSPPLVSGQSPLQLGPATLLSRSFAALFWHHAALARARDAPLEAARLLEEGNAAVDAHKNHRALVLYTESLHHHRGAHALSNRAAIYTSMQDFSKAAADLEEAVRLEPAHTVAWSRLGYVRLATGDAKGAVEAYVRVIEIYEGAAVPPQSTPAERAALVATTQREMLPQFLHRVLDALRVAEDRAVQQGVDVARVVARVAEFRAQADPLPSNAERVLQYQAGPGSGVPSGEASAGETNMGLIFENVIRTAQALFTRNGANAPAPAVFGQPGGGPAHMQALMQAHMQALSGAGARAPAPGAVPVQGNTPASGQNPSPIPSSDLATRALRLAMDAAARFSGVAPQPVTPPPPVVTHPAGSDDAPGASELHPPPDVD